MTDELTQTRELQQIKGWLAEQHSHGRPRSDYTQVIALQDILPEDVLLCISHIRDVSSLLPYCLPGTRLDTLVLRRLQSEVPLLGTCSRPVSKKDVLRVVHYHAVEGTRCHDHALDGYRLLDQDWKSWWHIYKGSRDELRQIAWLKMWAMASDFGQWLWICQQSSFREERNLAILRMRQAPAKREDVVKAFCTSCVRVRAVAYRRLLEIDPNSLKTLCLLASGLPSAVGRRRAWKYVSLETLSLAELGTTLYWLKNSPDDFPTQDVLSRMVALDASFGEWVEVNRNGILSTEQDKAFHNLRLAQLAARAKTFEQWKMLSSYTVLKGQEAIKDRVRVGLCSTAVTFDQWCWLERQYRPGLFSTYTDTDWHLRAQGKLIQLGSRDLWFKRARAFHPTPFDTEQVLACCKNLSDLFDAWRPFRGIERSYNGSAQQKAHGKRILLEISRRIGQSQEMLTSEQLAELAPWPLPQKVRALRTA